MGVFPDWLKSAITKPVYKNGYKHGVSNYRPAPLLTFSLKIFENAMQSIKISETFN
jgi:hypothetical protein